MRDDRFFNFFIFKRIAGQENLHRLMFVFPVSEWWISTFVKAEFFLKRDEKSRFRLNEIFTYSPKVP